MKILAIAEVDPKTTPEKIQSSLDEETRHAWKLYKEGTIREMYNRQDHMGVVFMLESESVDNAREIIDNLPFVREKLIDFRYIPLDSFFYFETLFTDYNSLQQG